MTRQGPSAVFVDPTVEQWIRSRLRARDVTHVATMPSNPPGCTAGKWGEWYPDVLGPDGRPTPVATEALLAARGGWRSTTA